MWVTELSRKRLIALKCSYLSKLADEGNYAEILNVDHDEPSYWDLAYADEIVPDDVIFTHYEGMWFVDDDFLGIEN